MVKPSLSSDAIIVTFCSGRFTSISAFGFASIAKKILSKNSGLTVTGKIPIFKALPLKISAKKLEITQRKP